MDGTVSCWGSNTDWSSGQESSRATPPKGIFTSISAGGHHPCGVREDGSVECWGANSYDSSEERADWPAIGQSTPPKGAFISISAAGLHPCGIGNDATVVCWGSTNPARPHRHKAPLPQSGLGGNICVGRGRMDSSSVRAQIGLV